MALDYETDNNLKALVPILNDYAEWYGRIVRRLFYPETDKSQEGDKVFPGVFGPWLEEVRSNSGIQEAVLDDILRARNELQAVVKELIEKSGNPEEGQEQTKLSVEDYDRLSSLYENFSFRIRRLEQDCLEVEKGFDAETGLRSAAAIDKDFKREMERLSRRGQSFCLVFAQFDKYTHICNILNDEEYKKLLKRASEVLKACMRSFDDAYRIDENEFVLTLKQTDSTGAAAAVNRMRRMLMEEYILLKKDGVEFAVTMSYCVAEPVAGDELDDLVSNMREDLKRYSDDGDLTLEYIEQSPLQRYIDSAEKGEGG